MNIQYKDYCEFLSNREPKWINGTLISFPNGFFITNTDGSICSVQPNGDVSTRPVGTPVQSYETFQVDSSINILSVTPNGITYKLAYRGI